ncbi:MAG: S41 family peptidase [Metallibacterium sp.]
MRRLLIVLAFLLPGACAAADAVSPAPASTTAAPAAASSAQAANAGPDLKDIATFTRVFEIIKQAYVDPVSDHALMQSALRGMLSGLDPHSEFLDAKALHQLDEDTSGEYAGLGIEVAEVKGTLRIIAPIDGTPAQKAGIRAGDIILGIDGKAIDPDALDAALDALRGKPGSVITLTILHADASQPINLRLVRETIQVPSVRSRLLAPGFAYVRVSQFQADTTSELQRQIDALQRKDGPLKGAVLDLRSNPGGLVTAAVAVADDFLDSGVIVSTRGRLPQSDTIFRATPGDLLHGAPLVVLIDGGTASAAEIVAGALKDNHRAVLMGRRSFGKGSVQSVLPLPDGDAVKLTTARYYTPDGDSIQARGITPDIELADNLQVSVSKSPELSSREADLPGHLGGNGGVAASSGGTGALAAEDWWLDQALHVLQALAATRTLPAPATSVR